jgi:UDP-glucose 4-epimerase
MTTHSPTGTRILVTGGAGFIGSHLTDALLEANHQVVVLDNLSNGSLRNLSDASSNPNFKFIQGDVTVRDDCRAAIQEVDVVFHLACLGVRHSIHSPWENHCVNAEGTLKLLEASKQGGVKRFFYISTSEVYGMTPSFPITEDSLTSPATVYGASKLAGENYAIAYFRCYGFPTTVFRIFNNYGPRAHYEGDAGEVIPRTIVRILSDRQPVVFGDGEITRDFFYVKDTARALVGLMGVAGLDGSTTNIGAGKEYTMKAIIESLLRLTKKAELGIQYLDPRPGDVPRLWVDPSRFHNLTNFVARYQLEEGLRETISYYKELLLHEDLLAKVKVRNWE